jgi:hypothetical protein
MRAGVAGTGHTSPLRPSQGRKQARIHVQSERQPSHRCWIDFRSRGARADAGACGINRGAGRVGRGAAPARGGRDRLSTVRPSRQPQAPARRDARHLGRHRHHYRRRTGGGGWRPYGRGRADRVAGRSPPPRLARPFACRGGRGRAHTASFDGRVGGIGRSSPLRYRGAVCGSPPAPSSRSRRDRRDPRALPALGRAASSRRAGGESRGGGRGIGAIRRPRRAGHRRRAPILVGPRRHRGLRASDAGRGRVRVPLGPRRRRRAAGRARVAASAGSAQPPSRLGTAPRPGARLSSSASPTCREAPRIQLRRGSGQLDHRRRPGRRTRAVTGGCLNGICYTP